MSDFEQQARVDADQNAEIDPAGPDPKDVEEQFNLDQAAEIDPEGDNPIEPGDLPSVGG